MSGLTAQLARVDASPTGPQIGAFFDLDGTLVAGYTAAPFYRDRLARRDVGPVEFVSAMAIAADSALGGDAARLGPLAVAGLRGQMYSELEAVGRRLFETDLAAAIRPEVRELVRAHQDRGHTVVLASSATRFQAGPIAEELGIEHVLCSEVECNDGRLTGRIAGGMLWGAAKAEAARTFARGHGIDARATFAYANGDEDVGLLAGFGHPCAVSPSSMLERVAAAEGWPVVTARDPGGGGVCGALRTAAAVAGMNLTMAAGLIAGRVLGSRRAGANLTSGPAFDLALGLSGVRLNITGREHLSERPAVFVFNHQSNLDPIIAGALVRRDFTATGKKEARWDPAGMLAGMLMDAVFLDREDPDAARIQIDTLIDRLRGGESVMIAPEGTRRPTPNLGAFKHGAFHVARKAGVPIVGLVLRNTGRLMPRSAATIKPGEVDVHVLPPVPTKSWKARDVGRRADQIRDAFEATLRRWPTDEQH